MSKPEKILLDRRDGRVENALDRMPEGVARGTRREDWMSAGTTYQFDLLNDSGNRDCLFIAQCFGDEHAVLLARALFESTFVRMKRIMVWRDDVLVHEASKSKKSRVN